MEEEIYVPGVRSVLVRRAPPAEEHESKRGGVVVDAETGMVGSMQDLRIQTVVKNQEFDRQTAAIAARHEAIDAEIAREVAERTTQLDSIRDEVASTLRGMESEFLSILGSRFDTMQRTGVDPVHVKADADVVTEEEFYFRRIPARNEEMTGELVRRMLRERQAFELDNNKIRARERLLVQRFEEWVASDDKRHVDEASDRYETFSALGEDFSEAFARDAREEEAEQVDLVLRLAQLRREIELETAARSRGDELAMESLARAMARLQAQVLEHFGAARGEEEEEEEEEDEGEDDAAEGGSRVDEKGGDSTPTAAVPATVVSAAAEPSKRK